MKVALVGGTGVLGTAAAQSMVAAGHDVFATARTPDKAALVESWGATAVAADVFDHRSLLGLFEGCDVVVNAATRIPVGLRAAWPAAWKENDRLRTEGVRAVVAAAREAHVRRIVQESVSLVYADNGEAWIDERSALDINHVTEPACVAESLVQNFDGDLRTGVVLRFGTVVGDDAMTRFWLGAAAAGRPVGMGAPDGWMHVVHTDDVGTAIAAALQAPGGVYNVGAEPVRRRDLVQGYADAVGRSSAGFMGPMLRRFSGQRAEPMMRSLRVTSELFRCRAGWLPRRGRFDASWLDRPELRSSTPSVTP
jgi:nucleoside-diphosphate-sugar epimerase